MSDGCRWQAKGKARLRHFPPIPHMSAHVRPRQVAHTIQPVVAFLTVVFLFRGQPRHKLYMAEARCSWLQTIAYFAGSGEFARPISGKSRDKTKPWELRPSCLFPFRSTYFGKHRMIMRCHVEHDFGIQEAYTGQRAYRYERASRGHALGRMHAKVLVHAKGVGHD